MAIPAAVVTAACVGLLVVAALHLVKDFGASVLQGFAEATTQMPPAYAQFADSTAKTHHIFDGALTLGLLDRQHLDVKWVAGGDNLNSFGTTRIANVADSVSISMVGDHVVTATYLLGCAYGLTVSAADDPIIGQDHLPGVGTYWDDSATEAANPDICSADTAPSSGWQRADPLEIRSFLAAASK